MILRHTVETYIAITLQARLYENQLNMIFIFQEGNKLRRLFGAK